MSGNHELVRAFIAIELPTSVRLELAQLQKTLRYQCHCPAKWVDPHSIHLTLYFLGDVAPAIIENTKQAMTHAVLGQLPFELFLDKSGVFPNPEHPRVIWIGITDKLSILKSTRSKLGQLLHRNELTLEAREFYPHLTLARIRDEANYVERQSLQQALSSAEQTFKTSFIAQDISLIQSQLTPKGAHYITLFRAKFLSS